TLPCSQQPTARGPYGEVSERLKERHWKCRMRVTASGVRIPPSPLRTTQNARRGFEPPRRAATQGAATRLAPRSESPPLRLEQRRMHDGDSNPRVAQRRKGVRRASRRVANPPSPLRTTQNARWY